MIVIYRPPTYDDPRLTFNTFIDDFSTFLEDLIVGDFNVHADCSEGENVLVYLIGWSQTACEKNDTY